MSRPLPIRLITTRLAALMLLPLAACIASADSATAPAKKSPHAAKSQPPAAGKPKKAIYFTPDDGQNPWVVSAGANAVAVDTDGIHLWQRKPENTINYAFAALPLDMQGTGAWQVGFDVRFGNLGTCPTAVAVCGGDKIIGWVGADNYYNALGSFFGKDFFTDVDRGVFPTPDREWHHFDFVGDGATVTILRDGKAVGVCDSKVRPDSLEVGQVHVVFGMKPAYLQQTETWVKGVDAEYDTSKADKAGAKAAPLVPATHTDQPSTI